MSDEPEEYGAKIPRGRLTRLSRLGRFAAGAAGEAVSRSIQQLGRGESVDPSALLLTPSNARRLADELAHLRGAAMKMGQMLSMEAGDILPPELTAILARLRQQAHPMPPRQLKRVLTQNWGANWLSRFEKFHTRPMAAASIGQVHRAMTLQGEDIAIKIQYPGVRDSIDSDVDNLAALLKVSGVMPAGFDIKPILTETKRQLKDEADYERESAMLTQFSDWLEDDDGYAIPRVIKDFTTPDILAMSYLPGRPIESAASAQQSERNHIMERLVTLTLREIFEFKTLQSDPNFANFRYQPDTGVIGLLDFGAAQKLDEHLVTSFGQMLKAGLENNHADLQNALINLGYLSEETPDHQRELIVNLTQSVLRPLFTTGAYDFDSSDLIETLRHGGFKLRDMGYTQTPMPMVLFVQRKIGGLYLLGARLRAKINLNAIVQKNSLMH